MYSESPGATCRIDKCARLAALWVSGRRDGNVDLAVVVLAGWNLKVGIRAVCNEKTSRVLKAKRPRTGEETTDCSIAAVGIGRLGVAGAGAGVSEAEGAGVEPTKACVVPPCRPTPTSTNTLTTSMDTNREPMKVCIVTPCRPTPTPTTEPTTSRHRNKHGTEPCAGSYML
jgi:hypothetical protein